MDRRKYIQDIIANIVGNQVQAEVILSRLEEEGVLHLGFGDAEVDSVIEAFKATFGTTKTTKQDRWAATRLVRQYGAQSVVGVIKLLGSLQTERYAPVANSVAELEQKMVSVINFLRKQKGNEEIDV